MPIRVIRGKKFGMAFRIHDSVVRGEIDNRVKGVVRGKIWVEGRAEPVMLELKGNACPDLAGCLLTFTNPLKRVPHHGLDTLHPVQRGTIGDLTASRKVRVFDVPMQEAIGCAPPREKPPEHMANCLYLEWFSEANGRVVIESADYELNISAPEWRMTPEENEQRARNKPPPAWMISCGSSPRPSRRNSAGRRTRKRNGTSTITKSS